MPELTTVPTETTIDYANDFLFMNDVSETPDALNKITPATLLATDLNTIRQLTPTDDDVLQRKSGAWANRTITQLKADIFTGTIDAGGMTSFEIPNSAAPTVDADGEIAVDTSVTDFSHSILKYYGGEELAVISVPIAQLSAPTDGHVITYNSTADEFQLAAPSGASMAIGGSITSATEGSVLFAGASGVLAQDNTNFFWDDTNNRLGLAINTSLLAKVHSVNTAAGEIGHIIKAHASQTGDLWQLRKSDDTVMMKAVYGSTSFGLSWYNSNSAHSGEIFAASFNGLWLASTDNQVIVGNSGFSPSYQVALFNTTASGTEPALRLITPATTKPGLRIELASSQTADAFLIRTSTPNIIYGISKDPFSFAVSGWELRWASSSSDATASKDTGIKRQAAGVLALTDGSSGTGWIQSTAGEKRVSGDVTNATATMADVTGLSATVVAGRTYAFRTVLYVTDSVAADGVKIDFDGGTATMTDFRAHCTIFDTTLLLSSQSTALATDFVAATLTGDSMIEAYGTFTVNAGGTFIVRAAQNSHTTGTLTVYRGSVLLITDVQ